MLYHLYIVSCWQEVGIRHKPTSKVPKFSVDENIEEFDVEYDVDDVQAEVEDEAVGVFLVSGYFSLVVDVATHIPDHIQQIRLRLPVRSFL